MSKSDVLARLSKAIIDLDEDGVKRAAEVAIASGIDPLEAVKEGLAKGIQIMGEKFDKSEIYLPELMLASDALKAGMAVLLPKISAEKLSETRIGKAVIGTVSGDIHDIGKNLVATMLSVAGFEIYDLGCDVSVKSFIEKAEEIKADIIAMSCLTTPSMYFQRDVIKYLVDSGSRDKCYVVIGGGCITPGWTKKIKADGWGKFSEDAVEVCKMLMLERPSRPLDEPLIIGEQEA